MVFNKIFMLSLLTWDEMAKKRKKERQDREGYEYKPPEFNEEEYLKKEVRDTKALLVTIAYAVLIGIASYAVMFTEVALAALLGIIAVVFLRQIYPLIGVDTSTLEKKQWAGNIIMYLFTWLAVWILLSNPPFADIAGPTFKDHKIYIENGTGNWTELEYFDGEIPVDTNISFNVTIADNVEVDPDTVTITIKIKDGDMITNPDGDDMFHEGSRYWYTFPYTSGSGKYIFTITAKDVNENSGEYTIIQQL
jgi:hypothetical protein